jgi:hypothetical protein
MIGRVVKKGVILANKFASNNKRRRYGGLHYHIVIRLILREVCLGGGEREGEGEMKLDSYAFQCNRLSAPSNSFKKFASQQHYQQRKKNFRSLRDREKRKSSVFFPCERSLFSQFLKISRKEPLAPPFHDIMRPKAYLAYLASD